MLVMKVNEIKNIYNDLFLKNSKNMTLKRINPNIYLGYINNNKIAIFKCEDETESRIVKTNNLIFYINKKVKIDIDSETKIINANILECISEDLVLNDAYEMFLSNLIIIYQNNNDNFSNEFLKLWKLFEYKNINYSEEKNIGLFGELIFMYYFNKKININLLSFWHSNEMNTYDFEITNNLKIEVKTTLSNIRRHKFSHSQINVNSPNNVFIVSILLEKLDKGENLYDFAQKLKDDVNSIDLKMKIDEILYKNGINILNKGISIKNDNIYEKIKILDAFYIPKIKEFIPEQVSGVYYNVTLENILINNETTLVNNIQKYSC